MENSLKCFRNRRIMSPQCYDQTTSQYKLFINDELNKFLVELNDYSQNDRIDRFYSDVIDIEKYEKFFLS